MRQEIDHVSNIIFDLGGVILNIDPYKTVAAMRELGIDNFDAVYAHLKQTRTLDDLEKGLITQRKFLDQIKQDSSQALTDDQILKAWNALLLDFPEDRIRLLQHLKANTRYRTYLLSNTNIIHYRVYTRALQEQHGIMGLESLFDKAYFSHELHMRKPEPEIYEYVLNDAQMDPEQTLFIDDSDVNIEAARKLGVNCFHLKRPTTLTDLFPLRKGAR
ncbi:MAG TPA: HAD family phosphatase [Bacteroidales bacterium]|nr:HAD family phosphatase [Bacteroidales bacterium]